MSEIATWFSTAIRERARWRPARVSAAVGVRVFYGFDALPTSREVASGGVVKTQDLQRVFPNTPQGANLLYLISSALPPYAPRMARWARRAGAKVVLNQNGVAYPGWHGAGWQNTNRFMREVLQLADHVFYQSAFCRAGADRFLEPRGGACDVLYNPVDTAAFRPSANPLPRAPIRLLLAGTHQHFYRVQTAVEALACLRRAGVDAVLEIAGRHGWATDAHQAEADLQRHLASTSMTPHVTLTGAYTQDEALTRFHRAHVLLHTKYNDPCPRLVVEAMACGLPVVYSESGGTPELVGREAGIGIPAPADWERDHAPDPAALARAVEDVIRGYDRLAQAARRRAVAQFDVQPWLERHRAVFTQLLEGRGRPLRP